jgi:hypothetical protein
MRPATICDTDRSLERRLFGEVLYDTLSAWPADFGSTDGSPADALGPLRIGTRETKLQDFPWESYEI